MSETEEIDEAGEFCDCLGIGEPCPFHNFDPRWSDERI